ncbi:hypothetical protein [Nannocystis bainbridge]|uniref:Uncharacterized protein n=1 Tax=Nannocystis bainbridge TaxID=2995303 RepID=A0ABT5E480_9BACT|nr:hypothetical protein [Nannocystis bainbridge]MDC0720672.1 hypothetical protein [Nannocystis bainbridge]
MALLPVDKAAYAVVRTMIAAGAAAWDAWAKSGEAKWPDSKPHTRELADTIFRYVPRMAVQIPAGEDNCPTEQDRATGTCTAMRYDRVFSPQNRHRLIAALDARSSVEVRAAFAAVPTDGGDLEWWATALAAGALIAIGGLPFAGAVVVKVAGFLLAAWAAYGFVTPKTPNGQSLAQKYAALVGDGLEAILAGANSVLQVALVAAGGYFLYQLFFSGSR